MVSKTKIISIIIVLSMITTGLTLVSWNTVAEDSSRPFAELAGYPTTMLQESLDSDQSNIFLAPLGPVQQSGAIGYVAQGFKVTTSGVLTRFRINFDTLNAGGWFYYDIRAQNVDPTSSINGGWKNIAKSTLSVGWNEFVLPSPPSVVTGIQYFLLFTGSASPNYFNLNVDNAGSYLGGYALKSPDDIAANYVPAGANIDIVFQTYVESTVDHPGIQKVAWDGNGTKALGVDGFSGSIYQYNKSTASWSAPVEMEPGAIFNDVVWDPFTEMFYIVGQDSSGYAAAWGYGYVPGWINTWPSTFIATSEFKGVEYAYGDQVPYAFIAVGNVTSDPNQAIIGWLDISGPTWFFESFEYNTLLSSPNDDILYDVAWNYTGGGGYYVVGVNASGDGVVYVVSSVGGLAVDIGSTYYGYWEWISPMYAIDWRPGSDGGIMVGAPSGNPGNAYQIDIGWTQPTVLLDTTDTLNDVDWYPDAGTAVIVGENLNGTEGVLYDVIPGIPTEVTDMSHLLSGGGPLYGIALKGYGSPKGGLVVGLAMGGGLFPSAFDVNTEITVNAAFPNLFDVDFYKTGVPAISLVNTAVDVEDNYTFYAEVNYTIGGADQLFDGSNNTAIDFMVWYDNNGANENTLLTENDMNRTRAFNVTWWEGDGIGQPEGAIITYPIASMGTNEFRLTGFNSGQILPFTNHWWITIDVYFGPQMRAADGDGAWAVSTNESDAVQSFNDANSWNFMIEVYDITFTTAFDKGFEEFGVNRFTNVTASGNPTGNAPPGSIGIGLSPNSNITYASNDQYYVNISVENLVSGPNQILASNLQVQLSSPIGTGPTSEIFALTFFAAANTPLSVWGNLAVPLAAPMNGTTSHGSWGSDFNYIGFNYGTEVVWTVNVPGATPEGVYTGQITITVESY